MRAARVYLLTACVIIDSNSGMNERDNARMEWDEWMVDGGVEVDGGMQVNCFGRNESKAREGR